MIHLEHASATSIWPQSASTKFGNGWDWRFKKSIKMLAWWRLQWLSGVNFLPAWVRRTCKSLKYFANGLANLLKSIHDCLRETSIVSDVRLLWSKVNDANDTICEWRIYLQVCLCLSWARLLNLVCVYARWRILCCSPLQETMKCACRVRSRGFLIFAISFQNAEKDNVILSQAKLVNHNRLLLPSLDTHTIRSSISK